MKGYDERLVNWVDRQFSIGQYVVSGFELPALVVVEAIVRLLPGVLGNPTSAQEDSFMTFESTSEYPQYTKPAVFQDLKVPQVLLTGHHQQISTWRNEQTKVSN